jgi:hypothetical protein
MNIKQKVTILLLSVFSVVSLTTAISSPASAATCGGVNTSVIQCSQQGGNKSTPTQSGVWGILLLVLNILTAGVGIAAVGGITYAAILYASASDRAEQVKHAKDTVRNVVIGIAAYAGMYLFLNFLIPGGIFT